MLDSVSSPITKRVYNLGLDEFFAWYGEEPRPGFTKATVSAWRVALEARGLGAVSINVRITAVRKLAVEAADNGLLAPELASGITRVKGVASKGVALRELAHRPAGPDAAEYAGRDHHQGAARPRDPGGAPGLRTAAIRGGGAHVRAHPAAGWPLVHRRSSREAWARTNRTDADVGQGGDRCLDRPRRRDGRPRLPARQPRRPSARRDLLSEKVVWQLLQPYAAAAGVPGIAPHDCRRTCAKLCRAAGGELEQIQLLLGHASVQTTERYLGTKQDLVNAPNDGIKLRVAV